MRFNHASPTSPHLRPDVPAREHDRLLSEANRRRREAENDAALVRVHLGHHRAALVVLLVWSVVVLVIHHG